MGHNHVVSGNPKSTGIQQVDGLSTGPLGWGCHNCNCQEIYETIRLLYNIRTFLESLLLKYKRKEAKVIIRDNIIRNAILKRAHNR